MVKQAEKSSTVKENICEDAMNALSKMGSGMSFQGAPHFPASFKLAFMMVYTSSAVNTKFFCLVTVDIAFTTNCMPSTSFLPCGFIIRVVS